ncbi:unnamed protein product, partial [Musa hybrid cultivar]
MARPTKAFPLLTVTLIFHLFIAVAGGERGSGVEGQLPLGWNPSLSGCSGTIAEWRVRGEPPRPRHLHIHQLQRPSPGQRPLLEPRRLLLQLPPRRRGEPLRPQLLRHHTVSE